MFPDVTYFQHKINHCMLMWHFHPPRPTLGLSEPEEEVEIHFHFQGTRPGSPRGCFFLLLLLTFYFIIINLTSMQLDLEGWRKIWNPMKCSKRTEITEQSQQTGQRSGPLVKAASRCGLFVSLTHSGRTHPEVVEKISLAGRTRWPG